MSATTVNTFSKSAGSGGPEGVVSGTIQGLKLARDKTVEVMNAFKAGGKALGQTLQTLARDVVTLAAKTTIPFAHDTNSGFERTAPAAPRAGPRGPGRSGP